MPAGEYHQQVVHHIREIRNRLLLVIAVLFMGMALGFAFYRQLFQFLRGPLNETLHYTSPAGSFNFVVEICFVVGLMIALPVLVYNVIMFIQPALEQRLTRVRVYMTTCMSFALAVGGAAFAFYLILPLVLHFFVGFRVAGLEALISASDYLNFVINVIVTFAVMFQLPLVINTIDFIKPLPVRTLLRGEKWIVVVGIVIALVVPFAMDPLVQVLVASPVIVLYNVAIGFVIIQHGLAARRLRRQQARRTREDEVGAFLDIDDSDSYLAALTREIAEGREGGEKLPHRPHGAAGAPMQTRTGAHRRRMDFAPRIAPGGGAKTTQSTTARPLAHRQIRSNGGKVIDGMVKPAGHAVPRHRGAQDQSLQQ